MSHPSKLWHSILLSLLILLGLTACLHSSPSNQVTGVATPKSLLTLHKADSCTEYQQYLADALLEDILNKPYYYSTPLRSNDAAASEALGQWAATSPTYVSQTNTQEQGVDEADIIEAGLDGVLYQLRYGVLHILKGNPPTALNQLGSLDLGINVGSMYLDDANKRVVAIGYQSLAYETALRAALVDNTLIAPYAYYSRPTMQVFFIDVSDPTTPVLSKQLSVEGNLVNSRRIGNRIHLISSYQQYWPLALQSDQGFNELLVSYWRLKQEEDSADLDQITQIKAQIKTKIDVALESEAVLPATEWVTNNNRTNAALLGCGDVMLPAVKISPSLLTITSIDSDGANAAATAIMNNAWQVYASQDQLYIAQGSGGWWWRNDQRQQTAIYQFDIGSSTPRYSATGHVDGWIKDAYSFSQHNGHLRLVTTQNELDVETNRLMTHHVLRVLKDDNAGELQQVGHVTDFGKGERVFSVRFTGDQGYVVTFRQIDPLLTFDLSDPLSPQLMGELEIPGFSTYMHPLGDTHLLTIGRSGNAWGATNGVQLQVFDVSDLSNPQRIHSFEPNAGVSGYSWSTASYDPHAFTYYAEQGLLAIPLSVWDYQNGQRFNGIVVLSVDVDAGITELGRVDHSDLAYKLYCSDSPPSDDWRFYYCQQGGASWWSNPRRSVFMSDATDTYLFSLSDAGVKATLARDPSVVIASHSYPKWDDQPI